MTTRTVIYLRDSGGRDQELSTEQQERALREYAVKSGYDVERVYADAARSGTSMVGRDRFLEMVEALAIEPRTVLLWDYSRFARDYDDGQYYLSLLRRGGSEIVSLKDHIPTGLVGRVVESLHVYSAAQYSEKLSENVKRGLQHHAVVYHNWTTGRIPTGYVAERVEIGKRRDGSPHYARRLIPDPAVAPLVQLAFAMRAEGRSYAEIHDAVHLFPISPSYACMFNSMIYIGVRKLGGTLIHDFCPPLVTREIWEAVQARRQYHPRQVRSPYLLSGLLRCGVCGHALIGNRLIRRNGNKVLYYRCTHKQSLVGECRARLIPAVALEDRVLSALSGLLLSPATLAEVDARLQADYAAHGAVAQAQADVLRREIAGMAAARRRLLSALEGGDAPPRTILERLRELERDEQAHRETLNVIEAARPIEPPPVEDMEALGAELAAAIQDARANDVRTLQLLLRSVIERITVQRVDSGIVGEILIRELPGLGKLNHVMSI